MLRARPRSIGGPAGRPANEADALVSVAAAGAGGPASGGGQGQGQGDALVPPRTPSGTGAPAAPRPAPGPAAAEPSSSEPSSSEAPSSGAPSSGASSSEASSSEGPPAGVPSAECLSPANPSPAGPSPANPFADARAADPSSADAPIGDVGPGAEGAGADGPGPDPWHRWLASPVGRYLLEWEQAQLDAAVADVFGYHAVQCGEPAIDALRANRMPHRVVALRADDPLPAHDGPRVRVEHFEELPFESQSLDLVVLPHVLEFTHDPHQVLREADRVLRPEGRLVVTGFNPVSLWGARQIAPGWLLEPFLPRDEHFIAVPRLRDWCKLLSFETDRARYGCYRPPCRSQLWLDRTRFMERAGDRWWPICGALYVVSAVKRVRGMRLIGPAWKRKAATRGVAVPSAQRSGLPPDPPAAG
jgi:SAM-dependent methyltransferase